jgi:hypothetical protein
MSRVKFVCLLAVAVFLVQTSSVFAIAGIGLQYGLDMTMKMNNTYMEQTTFNNLKFSLNGLASLPDTFTSSSFLTGKDIPIFINRTDWKNTGINLGGKIYIDVVPVIDAIEISGNFGVWQYNGSVLYPSSITPNGQVPGPNSSFKDLVNINYDTLPISLKQLYPNRFFWGVTETPYAKLHLDATVRKYLLQVPPVINMFKIYGGAGLSVDFATPMLSSQLIQDAIGSALNGTYSIDQFPQIFNNPNIERKIIDQILNNLMTPHFGCNIALGAMFKIPLVPIGIYIDGKYIILFSKLDKYVDVGGTGLLLNFGAALAF